MNNNGAPPPVIDWEPLLPRERPPDDESEWCIRPPTEGPPDWLDDRPGRKETALKIIDPPASEAPPNKFVRAPALVDVILSRASEGFVSHQLTGQEIYRLRLGGVAMLTGAPGTGKTSMALGLAMHHAREVGPVVFCSLEMDGDELAARAIGMLCDESWEGVLSGAVERKHMESALNIPKMAVLDGDNANLEEIEKTILTLRAEYPEERILVVVDYLQIMPGTEKEVRARVSAAAQAVRRLSKRLRVVALAISQPSRAAGRALSSGELLGADSMTAMAESAEIERAAYVTLALGSSGSEFEDGTKLVDLSIGKGRMGGGDRVIPIRFDGRTGRMTVEGPSQTASEVREERDRAKHDNRINGAKIAITAYLEKASEPKSRGDLRTALGLRKADILTAARELVSDRTSDVVHVTGRKHGGHWPIWTRSNANLRGLPIVEE